MTIQTTLADGGGESDRLKIFVRKNKRVFFLFRIRLGFFASTEFFNFFQNFHRDNVVFPKFWSLKNVLDGKVNACGGTVEVRIIVSCKMPPENLPDGSERTFEFGDCKMMYHMAAQEEIDCHGVFFSLEILLPTGNTIQ